MRVEALKYLRIALAVLVLAGCASSPDSPSSVLEPVTEAGPAAPLIVEPPAPPKPHERLLEQLRALGYEGLGMEFEDPATIAFLEKVFASPQAHNLNFKLVYTGMRLQYDATQKSVTIGGTKNLAVVLAFLKKKVPKRPASAPVPVLKPVAKPVTGRPALPKGKKAMAPPLPPPMAPPPMPPPPEATPEVPAPTVAPEPPPSSPESKPELSPEPAPDAGSDTDNPASNPAPLLPESSNP